MRFYINPGTTMTKAANLLGLFLLLASATPLMAQPAAADSATDEAVRRQAAIIMLRQRLAEAKGALDKADLVGASERYERAYEFVQVIGVGIDPESQELSPGCPPCDWRWPSRRSNAGVLGRPICTSNAC